jgi:hypothetical protein
MPSKAEQERRKTILREISQRQRADTITTMPISQSDLAELFDHLDMALTVKCDHSLKFTRQFLQVKGLSEATVIPWLGEYGGYCDCEVLANVEEAWEQ